MASAKHKRVKIKKRCCGDSKKPCRGCPLRPEHLKGRKRHARR